MKEKDAAILKIPYSMRTIKGASQSSGQQ
jgi:hypothetical protein